ELYGVSGVELELNPSHSLVPEADPRVGRRVVGTVVVEREPGASTAVRGCASVIDRIDDVRARDNHRVRACVRIRITRDYVLANRRIDYDFGGGACGRTRVHVPIPEAVVLGDDRIIRRLRVGGDFEVVDHRRRATRGPGPFAAVDHRAGRVRVRLRPRRAAGPGVRRAGGAIATRGRVVVARFGIRSFFFAGFAAGAVTVAVRVGRVLRTGGALARGKEAGGQPQ